MNIRFRACFHILKKFYKKSCLKICLGQDPDPDVLKSRIRILIRSKIVRIRNTAFQASLLQKTIHYKFKFFNYILPSLRKHN
jgi:hypothetical protein